jgi:hypothetical protein
VDAWQILDTYLMMKMFDSTNAIIILLQMNSDESNGSYYMPAAKKRRMAHVPNFSPDLEARRKHIIGVFCNEKTAPKKDAAIYKRPSKIQDANKITQSHQAESPKKKDSCIDKALVDKKRKHSSLFCFQPTAVGRKRPFEATRAMEIRDSKEIGTKIKTVCKRPNKKPLDQPRRSTLSKQERLVKAFASDI